MCEERDEENMQRLEDRQELRERIACGKDLPEGYRRLDDDEDDEPIVSILDRLIAGESLGGDDLLQEQAAAGEEIKEVRIWGKLGGFINARIETIRRALNDSEEKGREGGGGFRNLARIDFRVECPNSRCRKKFPTSQAQRAEGGMMCPHCGEEIKNAMKLPRLDNFHRISYEAVKAIVTLSLNQRMIPQENRGKFFAVLENGDEIPVDIQGVGGERGMIIESLNACILSDDAGGIDRGLSLTRDDGTTVRFRSQEKGRYYGLAKGVQGRLKGVIENLCSLEYFGEKLLSKTNETRLSKISDDGEREKETRKLRSKWAAEQAIQVLYCIDRRCDGMMRLNSPKGDSSSALIVLSSALTEEIDEEFVVNGVNELQLLVKEEAKQPMIHPPRDWKETDGDGVGYTGGFLTTPMEARREITSDEGRHIKQDEWRFRPSGKGLDALNWLQEVPWTVDTTMAEICGNIITQETTKKLAGVLSLSGGEKVCIVQAEKKGATCPVNADNIREWRRELDQAEALSKDPDAEGIFYHVWHFDSRGRMYTASLRLSPVGDDISRGLLRFACKHRELDENGWHWLQIYTAGLWQGRENGPKGKTFEDFKQVVQDPKFIKMLEEVVEDPIGTFDRWGDGDVLRSKAEGFLRLNATKAFIDARNNGTNPDSGVGAPCNLPIVQDASSNVYQHMSAIIRDEAMARCVNVLPFDENNTNQRADVYDQLANAAMKLIEGGETRHLPKTLKLQDRNMCTEIINRYIATEGRGGAKYPVMTFGYGAGVASMAEGVMSHSGKSCKNGGLLGEYESDGDVINCAHHESKLWKYVSDLSPELHRHIARGIMKLYMFAINDVLPGAKYVKKGLTTLQEANTLIRLTEGDGLKMSSKKSKGVQRRIWRRIGSFSKGKDGHALKWTLLDGSKVRHARLWGDNYDTVKAHVGHDEGIGIEKLLGNQRKKHDEALKAVLDADIIDKLFVDDGLNWEDINERFGLKWGSASKNTVKPSLTRRESIRTQVEKDHDDDVANRFIEALDELISKFHPTQLSRKIESEGRKTQKERNAISPNFIHSLDATHVRLIITDLVELQERDGSPRQLWAVHDAFGTHANDVLAMRVSVVRRFVAIHADENGNGARELIELNRIILRTKMLTTLERLFKEVKGSKKQQEVTGDGSEKCKGCLVRFPADTIDESWDLFTPNAWEDLKKVGMEQDEHWRDPNNEGSGGKGRYTKKDVKDFLDEYIDAHGPLKQIENVSGAPMPQGGICEECAMKKQLLDVVSKFIILRTDDDDVADLDKTLDSIKEQLEITETSRDGESPEREFQRLEDFLRKLYGIDDDEEEENQADTDEKGTIELQLNKVCEQMKEGKKIRDRIEELNEALEEELPEDTEDDVRESRMSIIAEIQKLEHELDFLPRGEMNIQDVARLDENGDPVSKYLVG